MQHRYYTLDLRVKTGKKGVCVCVCVCVCLCNPCEHDAGHMGLNSGNSCVLTLSACIYV